MTAYQMTAASLETNAASKAGFGKASLALVTAIAGLTKVLQVERIEALMLPAARRPKLTDIKEAIRAEFGGLEKEGNRQAYDLCSLAFRIAGKIEKEAPSIHSELPKQSAEWIEGQISAITGAATVDAWRDWAAGVKKEAVAKSAAEKVRSYLEKNMGDIGTDDLVLIADMLNVAVLDRVRIEQEIAERNAA